MSYLSRLECARCGAPHDAYVPQNVCRACGAPLLARYDLDRVARAVSREDLGRRPPTLWRYRELLPVADPAAAPGFGEGFTPCVPAPRLGRHLGLGALYVKDEGVLPTGSFKARGAAVGVARARELGLENLALPTAGNAGGAWAAYAARAGLRAHVAMPRDAPETNRREVVLAGAELILVDGLISDAGRVIGALASERGWFDVATLREPYRIEGKKTMGFELAEQFGWEVPDAILYPTGGGVGLIGIRKALDELEAVGWIGPERPRLIAVQADGCRPIVDAWRAGREAATFFEGAETLAAGIRVPKPLGDFLILRAIRETGGTAVSVSDRAILDALALAGRAEGLCLCPEGAACVAALPELLAEGVVGADDRVVVLNTGSGLKYGEALALAAEPWPRPDGAKGVDLPA